MKNNKSVFMVSLALILLVCAAVSTSVVLSRMNVFLLDDEGAISIISDETTSGKDFLSEKNEEPSGIPGEGEAQQPVSENQNPGNTSGGGNAGIQSGSTAPDFHANPGFMVIDENDVIWGTETEVEIFKVSYENGEGNVTVKSDNGEKVVAPGTENSYTFKLKNTGNVPVRYWLDIDAYITPGDNMIPIESRVNRYDGEWIVGGQKVWVDVPVLDAAEDAGTLGSGKYTYYTLDWRWPFESGNDEYDTFLGNLAADGEDITITIVIKTVATATDDPGRDDGITPPDTGDNSIISLWIALAVGSVVLIMILLIFLYKEKKRSERSEAEALKT